MYSALILLIVHCLLSLKEAAALPVETSQIDQKSRTTLDKTNDDYPDYQLGVRYDEYPTIVPKKRTALLVNRLMVALKEALEEEEKSNVKKVPGMFSSTGSLYSDDVRSGQILHFVTDFSMASALVGEIANVLDLMVNGKLSLT